MNNTEKIIESIDFGDRPDIDMTGEELADIGNKSAGKWGRVDWADVAYDSYKLGFYKGLAEGRKEGAK